MVKTQTPETPILALAAYAGPDADDRVTNDQTPTVSGTAAPGSSITVLDLGVAIGTAVADASGRYAFTTPVLHEGAHLLSVVATAAGELPSNPSPYLTFNVDTLAPDAPAQPKLAAASDTGISHSDGLTDTATPVVVGSYDAGAAVDVFGAPQDVGVELLDTDGTVLAKAPVAADGSYRLTAPVLGDGAHALTVAAVDAAGNVSKPSPALHIVVETATATATSTPGFDAANPTAVLFAVHFNEAVSAASVDAAAFSLVTTGTANGSVDAITGSGRDYTVAVDGLSGAGSVALAIRPGFITDAAGNPVTFSPSQAQDVDGGIAPSTTLVSSSADGTSSGGALGSPSANGRLVAFNSVTAGLVPGGAVDGVNNVFVKDLLTGQVALVSAAASGPSDGSSYGPSLSADGKTIAFSSDATNLVPGGTPAGETDVYVAQISDGADGISLVPGSIQLVSPGGSQPQGVPYLSADGSTVTFDSPAALVPGAETGVENVYVESLSNGQITLVSAGTGMDEYGVGDYTDPFGLLFTEQIIPYPDRAPGTGGDFDSTVTGISADGNLIAYQSYATDLGGKTVDGPDLLGLLPTRSYIYDVATGATIDLDGNGLVDPPTSTDDITVDNDVDTTDPVLSGDGTKAFFQVDTGGTEAPSQDLFEYDIANGTITSVSRIVDGHLEYDSNQTADVDGGLLAYTSNPGVYADTTPYLTGLFDTATGEISDFGQEQDPVLTQSGNATVFQIESADGSTVEVYENNLGISLGIDPIAVDDYVDDLDTSQAQIAGGPVSGTTNAPAGSTVRLTVSIPRTGTVFPTVFGVVDGEGHWDATLPLQDVAGGPGRYVLQAQVITPAGASAIVSRAFTVVTQPPGQPAVPAFDAGTPVVQAADGSTVTGTATPTFDGTAAPFANVNLAVGAAGATPEVVASTESDQNGAYSVTAPALADGTYGVEVQSVDAAGNASPFSPAALFRVDTTPPAPPSTPTLSGPHKVLPATAVSDDVLTLTGTAEPGATVTLKDLDANLLLAAAPVAADGRYTLTSIPLSDGTYDLAVYATDAAGNVGGLSGTLAVTVDTAPPAAPDIASIAGGIAADGSLSPALDIAGTAEPFSTVTLLIDGAPDTLDPTAAADSDGHFELQTLAVPAGAHALSVTATDAAGEVSAASAATTVTISATPAGPPGTPELTGLLTDGPIANAIVFADANGNGVPDAGEASARTAVTGSFTLVSPAGELFAIGGTDTQTGVEPAGALTAPAGSTVIDPLTTLLDAYAAATRQTARAAQPALLASLGLDTTTDLTTLDPAGPAAAGDVSFLVASAEVMDTATIYADFIAAQTGVGVATAFAATFAAMAQAAAAGPLALTDGATVLADLLTAAASLAAPGATLPAQAVQEAAVLAYYGNVALNGAATPPTGETAAGYVSAVERVEGGEAAPQFAAATGGAAEAVLGTYTNALGNAISAAETAVLAAPALAPASDTGESAHDNSTVDTTVTLTGKAAPGATVVLIALNDETFQTTVVGTGAADASGGYAIAATLGSFENDVVALQPTAAASYAVGDAFSLPAGLTGTQVTAVVVGDFPEDQETVLPAIQRAEYTASSGNDATHTSLYVTGVGSYDIRIGATFSVTANGLPVSAGVVQDNGGGFGIQTAPLAAGTYDLVVTETALDGETAQSQPYVVTLTAPGSLPVTAEASGPVAGGSVVPFDYGQEDIVEYPVEVHPNATTDAAGMAAAPAQYRVPDQGSTLVYPTDEEGLELEGGGDTVTGLSLPLNFYAPPGATVITPATSLLNQADFDAESPETVVTATDYAFENSRIDTALGQPTTVDLATADPLAMAEAGNATLFLKDVELLDTSFLLTPFTQQGDAGNTGDPLTVIDSSLGIYKFLGFIGGKAPTIPARTIDFTSAAQVLAWMTTYDSTPIFGSEDTRYDPSVLPAVAAIIAAGNAALEAHAAAATSQADAISYALAVERVASEAETMLAGLASSYNIPVSTAQQQAGVAAVQAAFTGPGLTAAVAAALAQTVQVTGFTPAAASTAAAYETFTITFSTPVDGITAGDFTVSGSPGLVGAAVTAAAPVAGSGGTAYTVTVGTGVGSGTLTLGFTPGSLTRAGGLPLGDGNFATSRSYSSLLVSGAGSGFPGGLAIGDFNGDGRPDVATANDSIDGLTLYVGQADGSFVPSRPSIPAQPQRHGW